MKRTTARGQDVVLVGGRQFRRASRSLPLRTRRSGSVAGAGGRTLRLDVAVPDRPHRGDAQHPPPRPDGAERPGAGRERRCWAWSAGSLARPASSNARQWGKSSSSSARTLPRSGFADWPSPSTPRDSSGPARTSHATTSSERPENHPRLAGDQRPRRLRGGGMCGAARSSASAGPSERVQPWSPSCTPTWPISPGRALRSGQALPRQPDGRFGAPPSQQELFPELQSLGNILGRSGGGEVTRPGSASEIVPRIAFGKPLLPGWKLAWPRGGESRRAASRVNSLLDGSELVRHRRKCFPRRVRETFSDAKSHLATSPPPDRPKRFPERALAKPTPRQTPGSPARWAQRQRRLDDGPKPTALRLPRELPPRLVPRSWDAPDAPSARTGRGAAPGENVEREITRRVPRRFAPWAGGGAAAAPSRIWRVRFGTWNRTGHPRIAFHVPEPALRDVRGPLPAPSSNREIVSGRGMQSSVPACPLKTHTDRSDMRCSPRSRRGPRPAVATCSWHPGPTPCRTRLPSGPTAPRSIEAARRCPPPTAVRLPDRRPRARGSASTGTARRSPGHPA